MCEIMKHKRSAVNCKSVILWITLNTKIIMSSGKQNCPELIGSGQVGLYIITTDIGRQM